MAIDAATVEIATAPIPRDVVRPADRLAKPEVLAPGRMERPRKAKTREVLADEKFFTWERVLPLLEKAKREGKTIAITNGHFVMLQPGHSFSIEQTREAAAAAREDGDEDGVEVLAIVNNGRQTELKDPVKAAAQSEGERAMMVYDNRHTDHVVVSEAPDGDKTLITDFQRLADAGLMEAVVYVKGGDYDPTANKPPEAVIVEQHGGRVVYVPRVGDYSTSSEVQKILEAAVRHGRIPGVSSSENK